MSAQQHVLIIQSALEKRKEKNPRYSLRAFASFLGLHPSALSRILSGKQDLSVPTALQILRKLKLNPEEQERFIISVGQEKSRQAYATLNQGSELSAQQQAFLEGEERDHSLYRQETFLRSHHQLLVLALNALSVGICVLDKDGNMIFQNLKMKGHDGSTPVRTLPVQDGEGNHHGSVTFFFGREE